MLTVESAFDVDLAIARAWDYVSDFTHASDWGAAERHVDRVAGDGGLETIYRSTTVIEQELVVAELVVTHWSPPHRISLQGITAVSRSTETIELAERGAGRTRLTYILGVSMTGSIAIADPLLRMSLTPFTEASARGLRAALTALPPS